MGPLHGLLPACSLNWRDLCSPGVARGENLGPWTAAPKRTTQTIALTGGGVTKKRTLILLSCADFGIYLRQLMVLL